MTTAAKSAKSTVLVWNYRKILELTNISGPAQSRDMIEVTNHDSANGFKEYIAGLIDGGEITMEGNFVAGDAAGQIAFNTDLQAGTSRVVWIVMPMSVGAALSLSGIGSGFEQSFPHDNKIGVGGSLKVTGKPTLYVTQSTGISDMTGIEENGGAALSINEVIAAGTYEYTCTVNTASEWVKLTVTAGSHTIYIQGTSVDSGVQSGEIALGAAGTDTEIFIMVYESAKAPRLYRLTVTRPAA
ncbi:MAG: phage tail tube protein [Candidatus Omnitrophota bacterium]|jgi:predicted secreted protein